MRLICPTCKGLGQLNHKPCPTCTKDPGYVESDTVPEGYDRTVEAFVQNEQKEEGTLRITT